MYLLDSNVLIRAHADYYPIERIPQFWDWLHLNAKENVLKIPLEIFNEIVGSDDSLSKWLGRKDVSEDLILNEEVDQRLLNKVYRTYAKDLSEKEMASISNDVFLITYAFGDDSDRTVVTKEVSKPSKQRSNRQIPDVCEELGIRVINDFELWKELDFRIVN